MLIQPTYTNDHILLLDVTIEATDYEPELKKKVKEFTKTAKMPGFRQGMVPPPMARKMIGAQVISESLKKLVNDAISNYVTENKVSYLGDAIQTSINEKIEPQLPKNYTFSFEFGLMPSCHLPDYNTIDIPRYNIIVSEEDIEKEIAQLQKGFGEGIRPDNAILDLDSTALILFQEIDAEGNVIENGINNKVDVNMWNISSTENTKLVGLQIGQHAQINVFEAFNHDKNLIARAILNVKNGYNSNLPTTYQATILEIVQYELPELNPGFYEKVFHEPILTKEDFKNKIYEKLHHEFTQMSQNQFLIKAEQYIINHASLNLPESFIYKYIQLTHGKNGKPLSNEETDKQYPQYIQSLRSNIVRNKIAEKENITVSEEEIENYAYSELQHQLMQYTNGTYQMLSDWEKHIQKRLEDPKYVNQVAVTIVQYKVNQALLKKIPSTIHDITADAFNKLNAK